MGICKGYSKDAVPGPDRVKYSDIKNLSVDNKTLFRLYKESFATGQVPEDGSHSYLKPIPKAGKDHSKLNGYVFPHNAEYHGKAEGTDCGQVACSGLRKKKRTSPKPRRIQSRKKKKKKKKTQTKPNQNKTKKTTPGKTQPD